MSNPMIIHSHQGDYPVFFSGTLDFSALNGDKNPVSHYIIDKKIAQLYAEPLSQVLNSPSVLVIEANESSKNLQAFPQYVEHLVQRQIRRGHRLVAIGGGIIQDITCFLAATMLRGLDWCFYPTTLLAQGDSCVGSKSSVNCGAIKNILGTFTPPKQVVICTEFLSTLSQTELQSGIGEMLKIHAVDGLTAFDRIAGSYHELFTDFTQMLRFIKESLAIKKTIIEQDEFDQGIRNLLNYGHSFGHAIESATNYQIPHGIAVTMGMDMANYVAAQFNYASIDYFQKMHPILKANYQSFVHIDVPIHLFLQAIAKDKKNLGKTELALILPNTQNQLTRTYVENNAQFQMVCEQYMDMVQI